MSQEPVRLSQARLPSGLTARIIDSYHSIRPHSVYVESFFKLKHRGGMRVVLASKLIDRVSVAVDEG